MTDSTRQPDRQSPGGGRLYQEFNSKQQRMARCGSEPPGTTGAMSPAMPLDGLTYQMMQMSFHAQQQQPPMMDPQYMQQFGSQFATSPAMQASMRPQVIPQQAQQRGSIDGNAMVNMRVKQAAYKTVSAFEVLVEMGFEGLPNSLFRLSFKSANSYRKLAPTLSSDPSNRAALL